jgi:hypothetical protein
VKSTVFSETTRGRVGEVDGAIKWFIRKSPDNPDNPDKFWVHEEVDGRGGFLLRGGVSSLQAAKAFVYRAETERR